MQTQLPLRSAAKTTRRKWIAIVSVAAIGLTLFGAGAKIWRDRQTPEPDAGIDRLARYMASGEFKSLPASRKQAYEDAFQRADRRGEVSPEQRTAVLGNLLPPARRRPFAAYFTLPPGKERQDFLDKVIDQQAALQGAMKEPPAGVGGARGGIRFDGRALAESIPPEERAQMDQFMQDLHDRQKARGLPADGRVLMTN